MIQTRVIPCLLLRGSGLVKTVRFDDPKYVGDPRNAVKIFNEKEVDELVLLDIMATPGGKAPQFDIVKEIVSEAFMPVGYGGGIRSLEDARKMLNLGVEKIIVNTIAVEKPGFIAEAAKHLGSQSVVVCLDAKRSFFSGYRLHTHGGRKATKINPVFFAKEMEKSGAGELIVNSIDRDGTMTGYDIELLKSITKVVNIPVVACGGAGSVDDLGNAIKKGGASAAAAGSLFVFHGKYRSVLISYPEAEKLKKLF